MNEDVIQLLEDIIPDIEGIDGGCKKCIGRFIEDVNAKISKHGVKYESSEDYPIKVKLLKV